MKKAFALACDIHIATLAAVMDGIKGMRASEEYRKAIAMPKGRARNDRLSEIRKNWGITKNGVEQLAVIIKNATGRAHLLGPHEVQRIAENIWQSVSNYLFKHKGRPRFKSRRRGVHSICGKVCAGMHRNKKGELVQTAGDIDWDGERHLLKWRKREFPVRVPDDEYTRLMLTKADASYTGDGIAPRIPAEVRYCRIVRRKIRAKEHFFLQLVIANRAPMLHAVAEKTERGALDVGPSKAAIVTAMGIIGLEEVAPHADMDWERIRKIQIRIDRSMRINNPDNYEPDFEAKVGRKTVKKKGKVKKGARKWVFTKHCRALQEELAEAYRLQEETRRRDHFTLINRIFSAAGHIQLEELSYAAFQKMYGKSSQRQAMGTFILRLKQKASYAAVEVVELNPRELRMSQWDHITGQFSKKPLSQRWHRLGETNRIIQRDIYSAILACCAEAAPDLVTDKPVFAIDPESVSRLVEALEPTLLAAGLLREFEPPTGSDWPQALAHLTQEPLVGFSGRGGRQGKPSARVTPAGTDTAKAAQSAPAAGSSGRAGIACGSAGD